MQVTYDRIKAVRYAFTYALTYNPAYPDLSYAAIKGGGDCNNFASQALLAGGWTMTDSILASGHWPTNWWFRDKPTGSFWQHYVSGFASNTWVHPSSFYKFLASSGRAIQCDERDLHGGDIVQAKNMLFNEVEHTMLVTTKRFNDVGVTYHTNNVLDASLNSYTKRKFGLDVDYIYWKLLDTYDDPDLDPPLDRD